MAEGEISHPSSPEPISLPASNTATQSSKPAAEAAPPSPQIESPPIAPAVAVSPPVTEAPAAAPSISPPEPKMPPAVQLGETAAPTFLREHTTRAIPGRPQPRPKAKVAPPVKPERVARETPRQ